MLHSHGFHELTTFLSWTFPRPTFPKEEYYEAEDVPEGSDAAYNYQEESHTEAEYADEVYGYAS